MNKYTLILALILALPLATGAIIHEQELLTTGATAYNATTISSAQNSVYFVGEHDSFILRTNNCRAIDIFRICLHDIDKNTVTYYPHTYAINVTVENLCSDEDDCVSWGGTCEENTQCQGACVHEVCRPENPWCGDDVCELDETHQSCPADCPAPQINQTTNASTNTSTNVSVNNSNTTTNTSNNTTNTSTTNTTSTNTTLQNTTNTSSVNEQSSPSQTNQTGQENQQKQTPTTTQTPGLVNEDANWLVAGLIITGGLIAIISVFNKKKKRKRTGEDLYSYRK